MGIFNTDVVEYTYVYANVKENFFMEFVIYILLGYLIGSIPTALIVSRRKNMDIRQHGSGNIGATNTFRVLGKKAGYLVSLIDILKGVIPTLIALLISGEYYAIFAGVAASIGHSYSIFANFKGGKSVATSAGVLTVLNPLSILFGVIVFGTVLLITKYVSLSSMFAAVSVVLFVVFFEDSNWTRYTTLFLALFIIFRHYSNISRLVKGVENKAFQKKK